MVGCDLTLSLIEQPKPALLLFYSNARQFYLLKKRTSGSLFLHPFPSRPAKTVTFIILLCLTPPGGKGLRLFSTHCKTPLAPSLRGHASLWDNSKTWLKLHLNDEWEQPIGTMVSLQWIAQEAVSFSCLFISLLVLQIWLLLNRMF